MRLQVLPPLAIRACTTKNARPCPAAFAGIGPLAEIANETTMAAVHISLPVSAAPSAPVKKPGQEHETNFHRIRITLASTGAPFYEPNPNTGKPLTIDFPKDATIATNSIHHTPKYATRIIAPVVPSATTK